jgi:hypothetical protein
MVRDQKALTGGVSSLAKCITYLLLLTPLYGLPSLSTSLMG